MHQTDTCDEESTRPVLQVLEEVVRRGGQDEENLHLNCPDAEYVALGDSYSEASTEEQKRRICESVSKLIKSPYFGRKVRKTMDVPATVTSKGQVTLPKTVREALGLEAGDKVLFRLLKGKAVLAKVPDFLELSGSVPVPLEKRGASWSKIRAETWKKRTAKRH